MDERSQFIFVTCQIGAEGAVKTEMERLQPEWRFSYSRPGFLTFKIATGTTIQDDFWLNTSFGRSFGRVLGSVQGDSAEELASEFWRVAGDEKYDQIHVYSRDTVPPGNREYEPEIGAHELEVRRTILGAAPPDRPCLSDLETQRGDRILDCVLVNPGEWWIGKHHATRRVQCWPGGIWPGDRPQNVISRAYLKMAEALDWSHLPCKPGQRCVELGCAPGGASQALLERELRVIGIDPADVDPRVAEHREFRHVRMRASDLPRRAFRDIQWLVADMNVVPAHTLACVRDIVTHRLVHMHGLILNLKFSDWDLAGQLPDFVAEVRGWGFRQVRARQLSLQRQEVCVTGLKPRSRRRRIRRQRRKRARPSTGSQAS